MPQLERRHIAALPAERLAVNETAAQLDVLVLRGRATVAFTDGVNQYTCVR